MVALIAFVPALIVLIVSFWTDSKGWTLFSAILMAAMGALTGNPIYAVLDVLVVYGAYVLANHLLKDRLFEKSRNLERLHHAQLNAEMLSVKNAERLGVEHDVLMIAQRAAAQQRKVELMASLALTPEGRAVIQRLDAAQPAAAAAEQDKRKG